MDHSIEITKAAYMAPEEENEPEDRLTRVAKCQNRIDSLVSEKFILERKMSDIDADISEEYSKMFE